MTSDELQTWFDTDTEAVELHGIDLDIDKTVVIAKKLKFKHTIIFCNFISTVQAPVLDAQVDNRDTVSIIDCNFHIPPHGSGPTYRDYNHIGRVK